MAKNECEFKTLSSCYSADSARMIRNLKSFINSRHSYLVEYRDCISNSFESRICRDLSTAYSLISNILDNGSK